MVKSSLVTDILCCGTCLHCTVRHRGRRKESICTLFDRRVMPYYPFCEAYETTGCDITKPSRVSVRDTGSSYVIA
jgi:hypothetical protein